MAAETGLHHRPGTNLIEMIGSTSVPSSCPSFTCSFCMDIVAQLGTARQTGATQVEV